jgi:hypothetical protein
LIRQQRQQQQSQEGSSASHQQPTFSANIEEILMRQQQLLQEQYQQTHRQPQMMRDFGFSTDQQPILPAVMPSLQEISRAEDILAAARDALSFTPATNNPPSFASLQQQGDYLQHGTSLNLTQPQIDPWQWGGPYGPTPLRPGHGQNAAISSGLQHQDMQLLLQKQNQALSLATTAQQQQQGGASPMLLSSMRQRQSMAQQNMMLDSLLARQEQERLFQETKPGLVDMSKTWSAGPMGLQGMESTPIHPFAVGKLPQGAALSRPPRRRRSKTFPVKLMETIRSHYDEDIVAWLPDGRSFVIVNPEKFVEKILAPNFKDCKYSSFVRKLNRWGFARLTSGTGTDCFYHALFQRERIDLCAQMMCIPRNDSARKKAPPTGTPSSESASAATMRMDSNQPMDSSTLALSSGSRPSLQGVEKFIPSRERQEDDDQKERAR